MARLSRKTRTFPKPTVNHWVLPLPGAGISVFETEIPALLGRLLGLTEKTLFDGRPGSQDAAVDGLVGDPLHGGNIPAAHAVGDMHQEPAALFLTDTLKRRLQQETLALPLGLRLLFLLTGKVGILGGIGVCICQRFFVQHYIHENMLDGQKLGYAGRAASASPAVGYSHLHQEQQKGLVEAAFSKLKGFVLTK